MQNGANFMDRNLIITRNITFSIFFDPLLLLLGNYPKGTLEKTWSMDKSFIAWELVWGKKGLTKIQMSISIVLVQKTLGLSYNTVLCKYWKKREKSLYTAIDHSPGCLC